MKNNVYNFLPFRFLRRNDSILISNESGEFHFLSENDFNKFIKKRLGQQSETFLDLKSKNFLYDDNLSNIIDKEATKYRTKNKFLFDYTSLHMFVVTLRCNQKCSYCHASSISDSYGNDYDMDAKTAKKAVESMFGTPSKNIKVEFQGGEPLLNFDIVKIIVEYAEELNAHYKKNLEFVICTNLVALKHEYLDFFKDHNVVISTSLDGPRHLHNAHRILKNGEGAYDLVVNNIKWAMDELGLGRVAALLTVTPTNLFRLTEVIDEYINNNLEYIFIRKLNPLGNAYKNNQLNYSNEDFISEYKKALEHLISINSSGLFFPEIFATILLARILTPYSTGFVDLQSPTGGGISGVIYDTNGDVFISDEARMLFRTTKDKYFCIGNVNTDSWHEIFCNEKFKDIISLSCIDAIPGCSWCVFKPYCGSDPVRNYMSQGDMVGYRPTNDFCIKNKGIFEILFDYIRANEEDTMNVFWSWVTNRSIKEIQSFENPMEEVS